jgi:hypothetical protein
MASAPYLCSERAHTRLTTPQRKLDTPGNRSDIPFRHLHLGTSSVIGIRLTGHLYDSVSGLRVIRMNHRASLRCFCRRKPDPNWIASCRYATACQEAQFTRIEFSLGSAMAQVKERAELCRQLAETRIRQAGPSRRAA